MAASTCKRCEELEQEYTDIQVRISSGGSRISKEAADRLKQMQAGKRAEIAEHQASHQ
jgi:hypothetical protein